MSSNTSIISWWLFGPDNEKEKEEKHVGVNEKGEKDKEEMEEKLSEWKNERVEAKSDDDSEEEIEEPPKKPTPLPIYILPYTRGALFAASS